MRQRRPLIAAVLALTLTDYPQGSDPTLHYIAPLGQSAFQECNLAVTGWGGLKSIKRAPGKSSFSKKLRLPKVYSPTGLLLRGIRGITEKEYVDIRTKGFLPDANSRFPTMVSLSPTSDYGIQASSLISFGPEVNPWHVAFVVNPAFVRAHPRSFKLVGRDLGTFLYEKSLQILGLHRNKLIPDEAAFADEIHRAKLPPEAIESVIVNSLFVQNIAKWDRVHGFVPLPMHVVTRQKGRDFSLVRRPQAIRATRGAS